jgi:hypothetical protein
MFRSPVSRYTVAATAILGACAVAVLPAALSGPVSNSITSVTADDGTGGQPTSTPPPASPDDPGGHGWIG